MVYFRGYSNSLADLAKVVFLPLPKPHSAHNTPAIAHSHNGMFQFPVVVCNAPASIGPIAASKYPTLCDIPESDAAC